MNDYTIKESKINTFFKKHKNDVTCRFIKTIDYPFHQMEMKSYFSGWRCISFVIYKTRDNTYISKIESIVERFYTEPKEFNTLIEAIDYIYYAFLRYKLPDMSFIRVNMDRLDKNLIKQIKEEKRKLFFTPKWIYKIEDIKSKIQKINDKINQKEDVIFDISELKYLMNPYR